MINQNNPKALTPHESAFAAEHHELVFQFLDQEQLDADEFYDVIVFGFLDGVQRYLRHSEYQNYPFRDIAMRAMSQSYSQHCHLRVAELPLELLSVEEEITDVRDYADEVIQKIQIEDTLQRFDERQRQIIQLLMNGYTKAEIAGRLKMNVDTLIDILVDIRLSSSVPTVSVAA